jgi:hypothetical protein
VDLSTKRHNIQTLPDFGPKMGVDERKTVYLHTKLPQAHRKNNANLAPDLTIG